MPKPRKRITTDAPAPMGQYRLTTGGWSATARLRNALLADLGGADKATTAEEILCEFAGLAVYLTQQAARSQDWNTFWAALSQSRATLQALGLHRRARSHAADVKDVWAIMAERSIPADVVGHNDSGSTVENTITTVLPESIPYSSLVIPGGEVGDLQVGAGGAPPASDHVVDLDRTVIETQIAHAEDCAIALNARHGCTCEGVVDRGEDPYGGTPPDVTPLGPPPTARARSDSDVSG